MTSFNSENVTSILIQASIWAVMIGILSVIILALVVFALRFYVRRKSKNALPHLRSAGGKGEHFRPVVVGFFHPYCNAGGGGERVLWTGIRALQNRYNFVRCVVYTGDSCVTGKEILRKAEQRFNISLPRSVEFVFLKKRRWVEASTYPRFTLLGQSFGSMILGWEALNSYLPDIFVDTMGYAFTLPMFRYLGGCQVGCYVHYPTISTDMLSRVGDQTVSYNNAAYISNSRVLSTVKSIYYCLFAVLYGLAGSCAEVVMVNSTWTYGHIASLWRRKDRTSIVYPPCDTKAFLELPMKVDSVAADDEGDDDSIQSIVSVGQFRPEKDHPLQIESFHKFLKCKMAKDRHKYRLILVGSCRNEEDKKRVDSLKKLVAKLEIKKNVEFALNVSFDKLKSYLAEATIGLHTMWNEHFGIGVVECMASGAIVLAHDSGGPRMDIVIEWEGKPTGFLASDKKSYASAMETIFSLSLEERNVIRCNARNSVSRFSEKTFENGFLQCTEPLFMGA
ncbi:GDP-Man:Man(3)GlcNAc(2)-PP-Dol alpha-1,2-mannosyltransferase-like [Stylophora pistillata]|uniref:GDP-Man:Man(3)GlcNAc(2)-PP-Dol alpha-1,2-mannosyltransferase-like n=1 Tax=Stylophora pistillata TaxID=50429 RepID=UPI000C04DE75|nr:GDP-Man:Man(3)GlcNAc(2)-PP-Dol alpha-1,2-mannosyltransferase-like [Stylophora pistillata]